MQSGEQGGTGLKVGLAAQREHPMAGAKRTDPALWERVRKAITAGGKGGRPGQWSARKAQMAVQAYKRRGGGYSAQGPAKRETALHQWTEAQWGTRSGAPSGRSGERYLPKKLEALLTDQEYARTSRRKRRDSLEGDAQFSQQPDDIRRKLARIRDRGPTRAMLLARARELGIAGRSSMNKRALARAVLNSA